MKDSYKIDFYLTNAYATGGHVLELACGNGRMTFELARKGIYVIE